MKIILSIIFVSFSFLLSCTKTGNPINPADPKLKRVIYSTDTINPLCVPCPPTISYNAESFSYDFEGRLITRVLTKTTLLPTPVRTDTTAIYTYYYMSNSSSPLIIGYTDRHTGSNPANHLLSYDTQNRIIKDAVTNPQIGNNKLTLFTYLPGAVIEYEEQTFPIGLQVTTDTLFIAANNVTQEKLKVANTHREMVYTASAYRNPFSYVNNYSLLSSDYKNGSNSVSFSIYSPQNITYNFPSQTAVKYWNNSSAITQYTAAFQTTLDSFGRIQSFRSSGNKLISFEYY